MRCSRYVLKLTRSPPCCDSSRSSASDYARCESLTFAAQHWRKVRPQPRLGPVRSSKGSSRWLRRHYAAAGLHAALRAFADAHNARKDGRIVAAGICAGGRLARSASIPRAQRRMTSRPRPQASTVYAILTPHSPVASVVSLLRMLRHAADRAAAGTHVVLTRGQRADAR